MDNKYTEKGQNLSPIENPSRRLGAIEGPKARPVLYIFLIIDFHYYLFLQKIIDWFLLIRKHDHWFSSDLKRRWEWEVFTTMVLASSSWSRALLQISPYTFSAIGIAISIGVSVLGAAWYFLIHWDILLLSLPLVIFCLILLTCWKSQGNIYNWK